MASYVSLHTLIATDDLPLHASAHHSAVPLPHRYVYFAYASAAGGLLLCLVLLMMLLTDKTAQLFTDYWLSM